MTKRKPTGGRLLRKRRLRKKKYKHILSMLLSDNPVTEWVTVAHNVTGYTVDFVNADSLLK